MKKKLGDMTIREVMELSCYGECVKCAWKDKEEDCDLIPCALLSENDMGKEIEVEVLDEKEIR